MVGRPAFLSCCHSGDMPYFKEGGLKSKGIFTLPFFLSVISLPPQEIVSCKCFVLTIYDCERGKKKLLFQNGFTSGAITPYLSGRQFKQYGYL